MFFCHQHFRFAPIPYENPSLVLTSSLPGFVSIAPSAVTIFDEMKRVAFTKDSNILVSYSIIYLRVEVGFP